MATSGWQSEQTIYTHSSNVRLIGNVRIDSITHSGNNLRVTGLLAVGARGNSGYYVYYSNGIQARTTNGGYATIVGGGQQVKVGGTDYHLAFDVTISGVAATATSYNFSALFKACSNGSCSSAYWETRLYWTIYFDQGATAPSTPSVSIAEIYDTGAKLNVSIGSYGQPSSEANRYIEGAILAQNTYGGQYRYATSKGVTSAAVTVSNSSGTGATPLTIVPNTHYWYGGYATNTVLSKSTVAGEFVTLPAYITSLAADDLGHGNIVVTANHGAEGDASGVNTEYSLNYGPWQIAADTFSLHISESTVIQVRRTNGTGSTPVATLTVAPFVSTRLYGSVDGKAEQITKLYGSVNGESRLLKKVYGSVDGVSKLIYEDLS